MKKTLILSTIAILFLALFTINSFAAYPPPEKCNGEFEGIQGLILHDEFTREQLGDNLTELNIQGITDYFLENYAFPYQVAECKNHLYDYLNHILREQALPGEDCGDCDDLKRQLELLEGERAAIQNQADLIKNQLEQAIAERDRQLDVVIKNAGCDPADAPPVEPPALATGTIYNRPFYCPGNVSSADLTGALDRFWDEFAGTEEGMIIRDARDAIEDLNTQLRDLDLEIKDKKQELIECLENLDKKGVCDQIMQGINDLIGAVGNALRDTKNAFVGPVRRANNDRLINFNRRFNDVPPVFLNINNFGDLQGKSDRIVGAIKDLTNKIPLFKGNEGGDTFGADENVLRAVFAETLLRLGRMAGLEEYNVDIDYDIVLNDVPSGAWFEDAMRSAVMNEIYIPQNNNVRPADSMNWAEIVTAVRRWVGLLSIDTEDAPFPGVGAGDWFSSEFMALNESDLLDDFDNLVPVDLPSKQDFVLILHRILSITGLFLEGETQGE